MFVWGDQNNIPLIKQKHRTENTINANKCELSKVQILLACFMQKQILMQKLINIDTQFLERAEGSFQDDRSRIIYLRHENNNYFEP